MEQVIRGLRPALRRLFFGAQFHALVPSEQSERDATQHARFLSPWSFRTRFWSFVERHVQCPICAFLDRPVVRARFGEPLAAGAGHAGYIVTAFADFWVRPMICRVASPPRHWSASSVLAGLFAEPVDLRVAQVWRVSIRPWPRWLFRDTRAPRLRTSPGSSRPDAASPILRERTDDSP